MPDTLPDIGLVGRAQVGKDTAARYFANRGYTQVAFADALRSVVSGSDPIVSCDPPLRYSEAVERHGYEEVKRRFPEARRFLQSHGVTAREVLGPEVWVSAAMRRADAAAPAVFSDVRFPNEADAVRSRSGVLVRIVRPGAPSLGAFANHESETALDGYEADIVVINDGDLVRYFARLAEVYASVRRSLGPPATTPGPRYL